MASSDTTNDTSDDHGEVPMGIKRVVAIAAAVVFSLAVGGTALAVSAGMADDSGSDDQIGQLSTSAQLVPAQTPTTASTLDDDGTPDQGPGDFGSTSTTATVPGDDDGTPDQGPGDSGDDLSDDFSDEFSDDLSDDHGGDDNSGPGSESSGHGGDDDNSGHGGSDDD